MIRGYYISQWSNNEEGYYPGPARKINGQLNTFQSYGLDMTYVGRTNGKCETKVSFLKKTWMQIYSRLPFTPVLKEPDYVPVNMPDISGVVDADFIYIRYWWGDYPFARALKKLRKRNPTALIFLELPDYPYLQKVIGWKNHYMLTKDRNCTRTFKDNVDYIVTMDGAKSVYGVPGIHIYNGIEVDRFPTRNVKTEENKTIHIGFVASAKMSHGIDRLIKGMSEYYTRTELKYDIHLHIVGGGAAMKYFLDVVKEVGMESHVTYYGYQYGAELDKIYDTMDMAVDYLALHRENFNKSSSLKSREYMARGVPIVAAGSVDICTDNNFKHILKYDTSDNHINIDKIVEFYEKEYANGFQPVIDDIRRFAEEKVDMRVTMKPVIDKLMERKFD